MQKIIYIFFSICLIQNINAFEKKKANESIDLIYQCYEKEPKTIISCLGPYFTEELSKLTRNRYYSFFLQHPKIEMIDECKSQTLNNDILCFQVKKSKLTKNGFILFNKNYQIVKIKF